VNLTQLYVQCSQAIECLTKIRYPFLHDIGQLGTLFCTRRKTSQALRRKGFRRFSRKNREIDSYLIHVFLTSNNGRISTSVIGCYGTCYIGCVKIERSKIASSKRETKHSTRNRRTLFLANRLGINNSSRDKENARKVLSKYIAERLGAQAIFYLCIIDELTSST